MDNNQLGLGVMISALRDNANSVAAYKAALEKKITHVELDKVANNERGELRFAFEDGTRLALYDDGQSCCESRYMTTDDDLSIHVGGKLKAVEMQDAPEDGYHEVQFLVVKSTKGHSTVETHNEHNRYYGGFAVRARDGW